MAAIRRTSTRDGMQLADRVDFARLEEAEEFRLDVERGLPDFVEEQRAAGGGTDDAGEVVGRAGERAAAVTEQLRVEHVLGHGAAVEGLEDRLGAVGVGVNEAGEHLLARARFAGEQDRHGGRSDAPSGGQQVLHFLRKKQRACFGLDRVRRPERRPVAVNREPISREPWQLSRFLMRRQLEVLQQEYRGSRNRLPRRFRDGRRGRRNRGVRPVERFYGCFRIRRSLFASKIPRYATRF